MFFCLQSARLEDLVIADIYDPVSSKDLEPAIARVQSLLDDNYGIVRNEQCLTENYKINLNDAGEARQQAEPVAYAFSQRRRLLEGWKTRRRT